MEATKSPKLRDLSKGEKKVDPNVGPSLDIRKGPWWSKFTPYIPSRVKKSFIAFDKKMDGAASFFLKHYGKSRFMVAMSKKAQYLGLEKLFYKGPKAFMYFFLFYLVRDTILYIIIPIFFAFLTTSS